MYYVGIDIGSTASKVAIFESKEKEENIKDLTVMPTGWNGVETANKILGILEENGINKNNAYFTATGYGRVSVGYANKTLTEITCHAKGAKYLFNKDGTVIDIGGQDTKIIRIKEGKVENFLMNDKCSAGTGRFLELMSNSLGCTVYTLLEDAKNGENGGVSISSMCTVFAESEVTGLMAMGKKREDIAYGVVLSIAEKVASLVGKLEDNSYFLTGGLCIFPYIVTMLEKTLGKKVITNEKGQFAGAIGAALVGKEKCEL